MREKANLALLAANEATLQLQPQLHLGMRLHNRVQRILILPDKRLSAIVLVPIIAKRENFLDRYDKKARLSVTMQSVCFTPSSYLLDAKASRGRARISVALSRGIRQRDPHRRATTGKLASVRTEKCLAQHSAMFLVKMPLEDEPFLLWRVWKRREN
jgi:hypothetical protein